MINTIAFIIFIIGCSIIAFKKYLIIYKTIKLGSKYEISTPLIERVKNVFLLAFGQKKMFDKPLVGILHSFIYIAFFFTQIELLEMFVDGLFGTHRFMFTIFDKINISQFYFLIINSIEFISLFAFVATIIFLSRRNLLKLPRLNKEEMLGWPRKDANIILFAEIFLIVSIFLMNSADIQYNTNFFISSKLSFLWNNFSDQFKHNLSLLGWWMHLIGVLGFLVYLPYSKHLHIVFAFINTFISNTNVKGKMSLMSNVYNEILSMMEPQNTTNSDANDMNFGAKDITELSQKSLIEAYSCTECGRCSEVCPANFTGKKLSPRKIMMDTRDRLEECGKSIAHKVNINDNILLGNYISIEELRACTTCNACVEVCPVGISPLNIILELRRNLIMEQSNSTQEWNAMFGNIETNGAPWKFSPSDRTNWAN